MTPQRRQQSARHESSITTTTTKACLVLVSAIATILLATSLASAQFLQPQSHLGRLVQSITSPLGLGGGSSGADDVSSSPYYGGSYGSDEADPSARPSSGGYGMPEPMDGQSQSGASGGYQQAAQSQHSNIPQQYYQAQAAYASGRRSRGPGQQQQQQNYIGNSQHQDEDQGAPSTRQNQQQEYAMGAYLGPTMDDKEINGAFNSNDERDEDDGPASYDGATGGSGYDGSGLAPRQKAASDSYGYGRQAGSGYGPSGDATGSYGGSSAAAAGESRGGASGAYDEDSADEDDGPSSGMGPQGQGRGGRSGYRGGLSQAASQYQQQPARVHGNHQGHANIGGNGNMMAAANGYAPYGGGPGPLDLANLMAGMAGGNGGSGYEVYNGDGSPYGYGPGQQGGQGGRRNQAASQQQQQRHQSGYYNPDGYGSPQQQQQQGNNDNDDQENDMDDD